MKRKKTMKGKKTDKKVIEEAWVLYDELISVPKEFEMKGTHQPSDVWPVGANAFPNMSDRVVGYIRKHYMVAGNKSPAELQSEIEVLFKSNLESIKKGNGYSYQVQSRSSKLMEFQPGIGLVLRKEGESRYDFVKDMEKTVAITSILWVIYEAASKEITLTHRGLFYQDDDIFADSKFASARVYDVSCMLNCRLPSLHVIPDSKGSVYGSLILTLKNGYKVSCDHLSEGVRIPSDLEQISTFDARDATFILVVEKKSLFHHLIQTKLHLRFKVILVTGSGVPDIATRAFLKRLQIETKLQVYCIVDPDPFGVMILFNYAFGSVSLAHDNLGLALPSIVWINISLTDLKDAKVPDHYFSKVTKGEVKMLDKLLSHKYLEYLIPMEWKNAIGEMTSADNARKVSIDCVCFEDLTYLGRRFIPDLLDKRGEFTTNVPREVRAVRKK